MNPERMSRVSSLFKGHKRRRFVIDHVIEGNSGTVAVDDEKNPGVAQLTLGQLTLFGGDPRLLAAREMVQNLPSTIVVPETDEWHELICEVHGAQLQKWERLEFTSERLEADRLRELSKHLRDGFQIERIDMDLAGRLAGDFGGALFGKFRSLKQFLEIGVGFCGILKGQVVCGASSAVTCRRGISIQINTHSDFLRRGFATSVGATLVLHCLEHSIEPNWSAATPISARLAEKLGYVQNDSHEELLLLG